MKCVIVYLVRNVFESVINLKNSIYFLLKNYLQYYPQYQVILFHEPNFNTNLQAEILAGVPYLYRELFIFKELKNFAVPDFIDKERLQKSLRNPPIPWWRNTGYRNMCRFYSMQIHELIQEYDYYMRLDDDSFLEQKFPKDPFSLIHLENLDYIYHEEHFDCHICNEGLLETTKDYCGQHNLDFAKVDYLTNELKVKYIKIFYNNFHVSRVSFWLQENVKTYLNRLDTEGNIYYKRWGDAPIQTLAVKIFGAKTYKMEIEYSKKIQRYAQFFGDKTVHNKKWLTKYKDINYKEDISIQ